MGLIFIILFTIIHFLLSFLFFLWSFSVVMGKMDQGDAYSGAEQIILRVSDILLYPVFIPLGQVDILREYLPAWAGIVILILNSLVWALAALALVLWVKRPRRVN